MSFFFYGTATTEIYTLSLHDALPISDHEDRGGQAARIRPERVPGAHLPTRTRDGQALPPRPPGVDRKSTRLNSSHSSISYAVFCLKKKRPTTPIPSLSRMHALQPRM